MVAHWGPASLLDMEQRFWKIMGYQQLWMLDAKLKQAAEQSAIDSKAEVA